MSRFPPAARGLRAHAPDSSLTQGRHRIVGPIDVTSARLLERAIRALPAPNGALTFKLAELEVDDGPTCAVLVEAFRDLSDRGVRVTLINAPQVLAHSLYRVAALPRIVLDPRSEEPTSS